MLFLSSRRRVAGCSAGRSRDCRSLNAASEKSTLRREAIARRKALAPPLSHAFAVDRAERGTTFAEQLVVVERGGFVVSAYWPMGAEADTRPLVSRLAE